MSAVLDKIRATTPKKSGLLTRARNGSVSKTATEKLQILLERHLPAAVKAWVDGLGAMKAIWSKELKDFVETNVPDHKVRAECALYLIQYAVGRAIDRSMSISGDYEDLDNLLKRLHDSPEAQRMIKGGLFDFLLPAENSGQSVAEGKESEKPHEGTTTQNSGQQSG